MGYGIRVGFATAGVAMAAGLSGCGSENAPVPVESGSSVSASPNITVDPSATQIIAEPVVGGPIASQKDTALTICNTINNVILTESDPQDVEAARNQVSQLGSSIVRSYAYSYINAQIAKKVIYTNQSIYTFDDTNVESDKKTVSDTEAVVDLINNPTTKALAETSLDYTEASSALDAAMNSTPAPNTTSMLLTYIENPTILALTKQAIGGNVDAAADLKAKSTAADTAVSDYNSAAFSALYNGSNGQAVEINREITEYNKSRQKDGN